MDDSDHHPAPHVVTVVTVVIVDDDPLIRSLLADLLNSHTDLRVTGAYGDGAEALKAACVDPPDVMLIDVNMPVMSGIELTRLIREHAPTVRTLALTSLTDESTLTDMLRAGVLGFLDKETTHQVIANAIHAAHSGLSVLTPQARDHLAPPPTTEHKAELTQTERRILKLVTQGLTNDKIAAQVYLSTATVKYHIGALMKKLDATNRVTLAIRAAQLYFP